MPYLNSMYPVARNITNKYMKLIYTGSVSIKTPEKILIIIADNTIEDNFKRVSRYNNNNTITLMKVMRNDD